MTISTHSQAATQTSKKQEEENRMLRGRIETLELDNAQMVGRLAVLERVLHKPGNPFLPVHRPRPLGCLS